MKKLIIIFTLLLTAAVHAQTEPRDATFQMVDDELGVYHKDYNVKDDTQKLAIVARTQADVSKAPDFLNVELNYARRIGHIWLEFFLSQTQATYDALFKDQDLTNFVIPAEGADEKESLTSGGFGFGYRFNVVQELFHNDRFYETMAAYITYNILDEKISGEKFNGVGLKADYGVHYRVSAHSHLGMRLTYEAQSLTRKKLNDQETRNDRSLTASNISIGFEYGFYY